MFYKTRVMVAAEDFLHGADLLRKGNIFVATEIDAEYLNRKGRATFAPETQPAANLEAPAPAPAPVASTVPVADDKPIETLETSAATEPTGQPAEAAPAGEPAAEVTEPAPVTPARRGGRRPQNSTPNE